MTEITKTLQMTKKDVRVRSSQTYVILNSKSQTLVVTNVRLPGVTKWELPNQCLEKSTNGRAS